MKKPIILSLAFLTLLFAGCSGLAIQRHKTDVSKEKDMSAGNTNRSSNKMESNALDNILTGLTDPIFQNDTNFGFGGSITFGAALSKVNFMPLASVDSDSGVIITEWHNISNDETRIKINVQVFNDDMIDESISVQLFQQNFDGSKWVDQGNDTATAEKIKISILEEARLLKTTADLS